MPPYVPHQEINASDTEPLECVLVRSDNEAVAINIDIEPAEKPEDGVLGRSDPSASAQALTSALSIQALYLTWPIQNPPIGRQQYRLLDQRGGNDDAIQRIA